MAGKVDPEGVIATQRAASIAPACAVILLGLLAAPPSPRAGTAAPANSPSLRGALQAIDDGDDLAAAAILEQVALDGDGRAQYLLGALYFTSKVVPANKPLGFAWLELAIDATGRFDEWSSREAVEMVAKVEPLMNGQDLVEADRLAGELGRQVGVRRITAVRPALDIYTREPARLVGSYVELAEPESRIAVATTNSRNPLLRLGCASEPGTDCPDDSATAPTLRCTGWITRDDDRSPAKASELVKQVNPAHPSNRMLRIDTSMNIPVSRAVFVAHVDAGGWVCSTVLAVSSGSKKLDQRLADALRSWRLPPATHGGTAVEALYVISTMTF